MLRSTLLVILFAFSGAAFADDFNYNSVTVSYGQIDFDNFNADGDTLSINGSAAVSESFHVFASYGVGEVDDGIDTLDVDTWNAGIGYNNSLSESIDLVVGLSYEYIDLSLPGFPSVDDDGFGLSVGLRMAANDKLEIDAGIGYVDMNDSGDNTAFGGGLLYSFTENFALGLNASFDDDVTAYNIGGRFYFGN